MDHLFLDLRLSESDVHLDAMADERLSEQLLTACTKGLAGLVPLLLKKGAWVNWTRSDGWTPLMSACSGGHLTVAQLLLDAGACVDAAAADGFTALMEACTSGQMELVDLLLQHGANISHATPSGRTAVILASLYGHTDVVELLLWHNADPRPNKFTALHAASGNGQAGVVQLLLREVPLMADSEEASGAFISACANGHLEVAQLLLEYGVSPCVAIVDGTTALMKACMGSHRDVAAELILYGASVEDALNTARRSKMPGVTRVLHRAVEEAMSRRKDEDCRGLDDLVRSIEGKKKGKSISSRTRSHFSAASTSTALAASETGATETTPGRPENAEHSDDEHTPIANPKCPFSGATWFKALAIGSDEDTESPEALQAEKEQKEENRKNTLTQSNIEALVIEDLDAKAKSPAHLLPWQTILDETSSIFPETTSSRLDGYHLRQMPIYGSACYTIEVLMEEPPSPISECRRFWVVQPTALCRGSISFNAHSCELFHQEGPQYQRAFRRIPTGSNGCRVPRFTKSCQPFNQSFRSFHVLPYDLCQPLACSQWDHRPLEWVVAGAAQCIRSVWAAPLF